MIFKKDVEKSSTQTELQRGGCMNTEVVVIGNIVKETIIFVDEIVGPVLGSPCAYSSIIMAKLGVQVGIVSYVDRHLDRSLLEQFSRVDKHGIIWNNSSTENNLIYDEAGNMSIEYANTAPIIHFEDILPAYLEAQKFFICPMNYEVSVDVSQRLRDLGKMVFIDLGGFGGTTTYNHFPIGTRRGKTVIDALCRSSTVIKASQSDLDYIFPGTPLEERVNYLIGAGAQAVVVTLGGDGAAYKVGNGPLQRVPVMRSNCPANQENLIGGGDAFTAGLIACTESLDDIPEAAVFGSAVASLMIETPGGCEERRMPTSVMVAHKLGEQANSGRS